MKLITSQPTSGLCQPNRELSVATHKENIS